MHLFTVIEDLAHHVDDLTCPMCAEEYPEPCGCGGLMHGEVSEVPDADGNDVIITRCDRCGRAEDER